jgi:hypothetical protein
VPYTRAVIEVRAESREQRAGSREQGAGSREQGAESRGQGAESREQGAGREQSSLVTLVGGTVFEARRFLVY